jgi:hypothetical protein
MGPEIEIEMEAAYIGDCESFVPILRYSKIAQAKGFDTLGIPSLENQKT